MDTEQQVEDSLLRAVGRIDEALAMLHRAERDGATVVRISAVRDVLIGKRAMAGVQ